MPPLPNARDLKKLLRKLGDVSRPGQLKQALVTVDLLVREKNQDSLAAITAAGAIPPLVQLLGHGYTAEVQINAGGGR
ncbi:hypothetical protein FOA52_014606 [Chlamydomonas sp. UWO 241]|nr:hypothetical protein FOA52_014606 [Chlamydomonas sp. UWO 241]